MKKGIFLWLALMAGAVPAYAVGHGTIVETDTAFIVDYSDDAKDNVKDKVAEQPAPAAVREEIRAAQPVVAPALPAAAEKPAAAAPKQYAAQKQARPLQRRGGRIGPWHRPGSMVDTPSDSEE